MNSKFFSTLVCVCIALFAIAQNNPGANHANKLEQMGSEWRSPNVYRNADGAPGPQYWQQKADYKIKCSLDTEKQVLNGSETITYYNNSPSDLSFVWLQLDENEHHVESTKHRMNTSTVRSKMSESALTSLEVWREMGGYGVRIKKLTDSANKPMKYVINNTMMRVDLDKPLKSGESLVMNIDWSYRLIDRMNNPSWGRGGYEFFDDYDNYLYTIVQWFPRMCVYSDFEGWQNKQFLGRGEFALVFGDYDVEITLPDDHIVGATGECNNYKNVLTKKQFRRWEQAHKVTEPLQIVTKEEALANEKRPVSKKNTTWKYTAKNVRDFAWTASKKFVWDAMPHITEVGDEVMCMSYFGKEAYPIYNRYSTKVTEFTLKTYSKYSIPYPYPTAISVEAANGMEYPMICFNPGRAEPDGTYSENAKLRALLVIIHEVGHNYFPMIINSDERQWAWFDEGINTFMQFITEQEFDNNFKSRGGVPHKIASYMGSPKSHLEPIMTNSENIKNYGANAYSKPATAINILRETIMGRELFDYAFKEYCKRWAFKHPTPEDFFRTMEEASAVDLDWYWRGWFYSTDNVDIAIDSVKWFRVNLEENPEPVVDTFTYNVKRPEVRHLTQIRNRESGHKFPVEQDPSLQDFYYSYDPFAVGDTVINTVYGRYNEAYTKDEKIEKFGNKHFYQLHISNIGGLLMPVIIEWTFEDGSTQLETIPVEIWRLNEDKFTKVFIKDQKVRKIQIDPRLETADTNVENNYWPIEEIPETPDRFKVYKKNKSFKNPNAMQRAGLDEK